MFECSEENQDCNVKFTTRNDLNLRWIVDSNINQCWVPYVNIICVIDPPEVQGRSSRVYHLKNTDYDTIISLKDNFIN